MSLVEISLIIDNNIYNICIIILMRAKLKNCTTELINTCTNS